MAQIDALEKIVFNYLSNAIKYSNPQGIISMRLEVKGDKAVISVIDNGPGIAKEDMPKLFSIFSQIGDSGKMGLESSGLGLALVKELTESMNGRVFADSALGQGSVFGVEFPIIKFQKKIIDILIFSEDGQLLSDAGNRFEKEELKIQMETSFQSLEELNDRFEYYCILIDYSADKRDDFIRFFKKLDESGSIARKLVIGGSIQDINTFLAGGDVKIDKSYVKPLDFCEFIEDARNFVNESPIKKETVEENFSYYSPKKWHFFTKDDQTDESYHDDDIIRNEDEKLILVVDDLLDMRNLLKQILKKRNYRVITAKDGEAGLEKAISFKPDLMIIDWMMPKISGPQMIEGIMANSELNGIPTILLTAKGDEESKLEGIRAGANAYLSKPFDEIELLSTVENLIKLKAGEEKIRQLHKNLTENVLKRFLPHKLVNDIISGKKAFIDQPDLMDITILFADLVNFTDKVEHLGPLLISPVLNEYFSKMTQIVFDFGGTVDKFIGDGIMVIFGAPEREKSATQAKKAADCSLAMQDALEELNKKWKEKHNVEFAMRIGIHRGCGLVGSFGSEKRSEYTAIGPVVNMASRIQKAAEPGSIFFSGDVRDNLTSHVWIKAGTYNLKGIGETVLFKLQSSEEENVA
ncbi:MAG: response regulator, partial [Oligoflexales bacterium]|nr:response regulator [Oligoflexales bacterium]